MMPIDYRGYHPDWHSISRQIREQADNKCEFCDVPNGEYILRDRKHPERWHIVHGMEIEVASLDGEWVTLIVLTVAHLNHIKSDNDPANLKALCQRCHLNWDRERHLEKQRQNREAKRLRIQPALLEVA